MMKFLIEVSYELTCQYFFVFKYFQLFWQFFIQFFRVICQKSATDRTPLYSRTRQLPTPSSKQIANQIERAKEPLTNQVPESIIRANPSKPLFKLNGITNPYLNFHAKIMEKRRQAQVGLKPIFPELSKNSANILPEMPRVSSEPQVDRKNETTLNLKDPLLKVLPRLPKIRKNVPANLIPDSKPTTTTPIPVGKKNVLTISDFFKNHKIGKGNPFFSLLPKESEQFSTKTIQTSPTPKFKRHTKTPAEFPNVLQKSQLPEVVRKSREPSLLHQPRIETIRRLRKEKTLNHPTSTPKPVHDIDPSLFPIRHLVPPLLNYPFSSPKLSVNSNINSFSRKDPLLELIYENYLEEKKFKSTTTTTFPPTSTSSTPVPPTSQSSQLSSTPSDPFVVELVKPTGPILKTKTATGLNKSLTPPPLKVSAISTPKSSPGSPKGSLFPLNPAFYSGSLRSSHESVLKGISSLSGGATVNFPELVGVKSNFVPGSLDSNQITLNA